MTPPSREAGEATVGAAVLGAYAFGAPLVVAMTTAPAENVLIRVAAVFAALTAIGIGVSKIWKVITGFVHRLDQIADLVTRAERMELRQLATSDQLRDLTARVDKVLPPRETSP